MEGDIKFCNFVKDYSWQDRAIEFYFDNLSKFYSSSVGNFDKAYFVEVSPSGGKTIFSLKLAQEMIKNRHIDFIVWCVPRDSIKLGFEDDCQKLTPMPDEFRKANCKTFRIDTKLGTHRGELNNVHGLAITYQALNESMIGYLDWLSGKKRMMFVFDEAHHCSGNDESDDDYMANVWGDAIHTCSKFAHSIVLMSGTPLRSDNKKIALVEYESDNILSIDGTITTAYKVKADFIFSYKDAVSVGIARKIIVRNQDPMITYEVHQPDGQTNVLERNLTQIPKKHLAQSKKSLFCFERGKENVDQFLMEAFKESELLRNTGDADAAILVIGSRDIQGMSNSLEKISERIQALTNEFPVTVESVDGPEAKDKIKEFKTANTRWIVAKEMISEGTNIPRIRIILLLRDIGNKTFYEQLAHRATRNDADDRPEDAFIIQPALPNLVEWARTLEEEGRYGYVNKSKIQGVREPIDVLKEKIFGISAVPDDESVIIEGEDFTDIDPIAREIHAAIGAETKTSRYQIIKILKAVPKYKENPKQSFQEEPLFTVEEQCTRFRTEINSICRWVAGDSGGHQDLFKNIIRECKTIAGIKGSFEQIMKEDPDPLTKFKRLYKAASTIRERYVKHKERG